MVVPTQPSEDLLDQATAKMLAAAVVLAKAFMQAEPEAGLTDELWQVCQDFERSVAKVRALKG